MQKSPRSDLDDGAELLIFRRRQDLDRCQTAARLWHMQIRWVFLGVAAEAFNVVRWAQSAWFFNGPMARSLAPKSTVIYPSAGVVFGPLDDVVMGGSSASTWTERADGALWTGNMVSQSGGFCGARCRAMSPPLDASRFKGIRVAVDSPEALRSAEIKFKFLYSAT